MPVHLLDQREHHQPRFDVQLLQHTCERLLTQLGLVEKTLSLVLLSDRQMAAYNLQYRGKDGPTNVLSFPAAFPGEVGPAAHNDLGDVLLAVDTAQREAAVQHCTLLTRLVQLSIHGVLHLIGYDHERSEDEAQAMWDEEQQLFTQLFQTRRRTMPHLAINVDHVATLRQARGTVEPDPVLAAGLCELAGARGIVVHLREDRRHIQDRDVQLLRQTVKTKLNLEMAVTKDMLALAIELKPDLVTLVPEKRQELTTEGGLDVVGTQKKTAAAVAKLRKAGIPVSLFVDADAEQIQAAAEIDATHIELHTGHYCDAVSIEDEDHEFLLLRNAAELAAASSLKVNAGHGLDYRNTARIAAIPEIDELSIGHAVVSRAVLVGMEQAVREMLDVIRQATC
ncbi:MAG: pyridoxine 5'-phosphate synthase [Desulfobulbaceae bacterium]|nr:pyridoxine 5'-phosphate synthase [Desulfobulbaceae bacterium]